MKKLSKFCVTSKPIRDQMTVLAISRTSIAKLIKTGYQLTLNVVPKRVVGQITVQRKYLRCLPFQSGKI